MSWISPQGALEEEQEVTGTLWMWELAEDSQRLPRNRQQGLALLTAELKPSRTRFSFWTTEL